MTTTPISLRAARTECEQRGYHGPFLNQERYDRYPEWRGMGDCAVCGLTRDVARQEALRLAAVPAA